MKSIYLATVFLCTAVEVPAAAPGAETNQAPSQAERPRTLLTTQIISDLTEEARTNNAGLWAARSRITAAEQNALSVPLWRDPEVMAGTMAADRAMRADDGDIIYGAEQGLPLFGKERAVQRSAKAEVPMEQADYEFRFQMMRKELAEALFEAAYRDESFLLSEENCQWLETMTRTLEDRYRVGDATQLELFKVQNERSRHAQQLVSDYAMRNDAYAVVNRILNRNVHAGWELMALPEPAIAVPMNERLIQFALKYEPKLRALRKQLDVAESRREVAQTEKRPDLALAVEGRHYSGTGEGRSATVLVKMKLPWLNRDKYRAAVNRESARVKEVESLIEDYTYQVQEELHHLTSRIDISRREALLYRNDIIPRSRLAVASAEAAWRENRGSLRDVLEAREMLIAGRRSYFKAVAEQYKALSDLVLCCGAGDLEAIEMLNREEGGPTPENDGSTSKTEVKADQNGSAASKKKLDSGKGQNESR